MDGSHFSLSNDTDSDPQSDYNPGIWAIKTQKRALKYSQDILNDGDEITVETYKNPRNYPLANKFIKALGLKQPLFEELSTLRPIESVPTGDKPQNLSQLKKYLSVGRKIHIKNMRNGEWVGRDTVVLRTTTKDVVLEKYDLRIAEKTGTPSWLYMGNASDWSFDNEGATKWFLDREGWAKSSRIEYINN